ncbi:MAG: hypothetical protein EOO39_37340 [Cytophagaceae bacterium]|nr:MAG: hypothetical protein EOO39_37340 [Cytophagaceae bacterium]
MSKNDDPQKIVFTWKILLITLSLPLAMIPALIAGFQRNSQRKAIRQNQDLTVGTVTRFERGSNGKRRWYNAYADYRANNRVYTCVGQASILLTKNQRDSLIGVRLPVIYERGNPENAHLLTGLRAFNRFNFDLPDSLSWTTSYFTN